MRSQYRVAAVLAAVITIIGPVASCDRGDGDLNPEAQFAPSLRPAFGARVTDGKLVIWTGTPCEALTRVALEFEPGGQELVLTAPADAPARIEYLTVGGPYPGLKVSTALPNDFDWRQAQRVDFSAYPNAWGYFADIAEVVKGSAEHPADTYWFQDVGWLNPAAVAEQNAATFLTPCTPDPAKS